MANNAPAIDQLIQDLRDFRRRPAAVLALRNRGKDATSALIELLRGSDSGLAWVGARLLGEIGDAAAVPALREAAANPDLATVATDALQALGQDLPTVAQDRPHAGKTAKELTDDQLLEAALAPHTLTAAKLEDGLWTVEAPTGANDETQEVRITMPRDETDGTMVCIYVDTGVQAYKKNHEWALRLNPRLPYGAIGVQDIAGKPTFLLSDTQLRATADPPEIEKTVLGLAKNARRIRERLENA